MNDFTKEELKSLRDLVQEVCKEYQAQDDNDADLEGYWIPLKHKLEDIINRDCSHEWDGSIRLSMPPQCKCIKCGEFYQWNIELTP